MGSNHYAQEAHTRARPKCPKCGRVALEVKTRYGLRNKCCDLWSWDRHPLVDAETHKARNEAHAAFDKLWRKGVEKVMGRNEAHAALADQMNLAPEQCHMKLMDADTAHRVPIAVQAIRAMKADTKGDG